MKEYENQIIQGDSLEVLKTLPDNSINSCITSPPYYGLRDYGVAGQLGLERTYKEYINKLCDIFDEVKRVLTKDGTIWVNIGDSYSTAHTTGQTDQNAGWSSPGNKRNPRQAKHGRANGGDVKEKSLLQIPARFAIEMSNRGWILRNEIIWHKETCMPSSATDRFTVDFEKIFFFVKNPTYYFEQQLEPYTEPMNRWGGDKLKATGESMWDKGTGQNSYRDRDMRPNPEGRNKRCVWTINPKPFKEAHFATFPTELIKTPVKAGCPKGGIILDPFMGSGTTALVAKLLNRKYVGIELNSSYIEIANRRLRQEILL